MKTRRKRRDTSPAWAALCLVAAAVLAAGCTGQPEGPLPTAAPPSETKEKLTFGLAPEQNVFAQKKKFLDLELYLSEKLNKDISFRMFDNYHLMLTELLEQKIDGGFWGSMNGAVAQMWGVMEILARPMMPDSGPTYSSYIFTREESGLTGDPLSWSGKSIALVSKMTAAGYLYPLSLLREAGIETDLELHFGHTYFAGSHDVPIREVLQGRADLGAAKSTVFNSYMQTHPDEENALVILSESPPLPSNGLGVRVGLSDELKEKLALVLLNMHNDARGHEILLGMEIRKFIPSSFDDYQPVLEMADKAGVDLTNLPIH